MDGMRETTILWTVHADDRVTVDRFPDTVYLSEAALEASTPELLKRDGDFITFTPANGTARYEIDSLAGGSMFPGLMYILKKISSEIRE